jgi:hypothetical protein
MAMDKQTALKELETEYNNLLSTLQGLDERAMSKRFYGDWNVKDILAHIGGWWHQSAQMLERMSRGEKPAPEGTDYSDPDAWNARFAAAMKPQSGETVIADLRQAYANTVRAAKQIPDDRFGEGKTVNKILDGNGFGHIREHLPAIAEYKKSSTA